MDEAHSPRSTRELIGGDFYRHARRWYMASGAARATQRCYEVPSLATDGSRCFVLVFDEQVEAWPRDGGVPPAFKPSALRRRAKKSRADAANLRDAADRIDALATRIASNKQGAHA